MIKLRPYQKEVIDKSIAFFNSDNKKDSALVVAPTACHAKGTKILMYDGTFKCVEDIQVNDLLMGIDSSPRTVFELYKGCDTMYEITPKKLGKPFIVNSEHILSLYKTNEGSAAYQKPKITDISVKEYLIKDKRFKHIHKLRYCEGVEFTNKEVPLDPYFLGIYLGDGGSANGAVSICTPDEEIVSYLYKFIEDKELRIRVCPKKDNKAYSYYFAGLKRRSKNPNYLKIKLVELGLYKKICHEKFIPDIYLRNSKAVRLQILAGLLDTDGYFTEERYSYEYCTKSKIMAEQIVYLCRSLGFFAKIGKTKIVKDQEYYRLTVGGKLYTIPTKITRKTASCKKTKRDCMKHGFDIKELGLGDYYGFKIDGDNLYFDSEFLIHHNCGKSILISNTGVNIKGNTIVLQPSKEILEQNQAKFYNYGYEVGVFSAGCGRKDINKITLGTIGTVINDMEKFNLFDNIIIDECDLVNSEEGQYKDFINYLGNVKLLGYTATPFRMHYNRDGAICKMLTRTNPKIFKKILHNITIQEMYANGYLCPMIYELHKYNTSKLKLTSNLANYNEDSLILANKQNNIAEKVINCIKNHSERKHFIVFTVSVKEAEEICEYLNRNMIKSTTISCKTPAKERAQRLADYRDGYYKVILNVGTLTCGWDYPPLDCIIDARKTMSLRLMIQRWGRGVRLFEGKENCLYIDLVGNVEYFGKPENMRLVTHYEDYRHRWYSEEKGFLTGVYLHNGYDIEDDNYQRNKNKVSYFNKQEKFDDVVLTFGKFSGISISKVPVWYVKWGCENLKNQWKLVFENELNRRGS